MMVGPSSSILNPSSSEIRRCGRFRGSVTLASGSRFLGWSRSPPTRTLSLFRGRALPDLPRSAPGRVKANLSDREAIPVRERVDGRWIADAEWLLAAVVGVQAFLWLNCGCLTLSDV